MTKRNYYQEHLDFLEKGESLTPQEVKLKEHIDRSRAMYFAAARGVIEELKENGFDVSSARDLRMSGRKYLDAIPILIKWLPKVKYQPLKDDIVRTLSRPWAKAATEGLLEEFQRAKERNELKFAWLIGNALEAVAHKKYFAELTDIIRDTSADFARQMVIRAVAKTKHPDARGVLLELLKAADEVGHTMYGLRRLKAPVPRDLVEPYLTHELPWVRKEAKKLLELQDKLDAQEP